MRPIETARTLLLGRRMPPPAELPPDSVPSGVVLRSGGLVPRIGGLLARLGGPAAAVTLGRNIVVRPGTRLTRSLLEHELVHVEQWRKDPFFPIRYTLATIRHGYWNNPYEVEARAAQAPAVPPTPHREST